MDVLLFDLGLVALVVFCGFYFLLFVFLYFSVFAAFFLLFFRFMVASSMGFCGLSGNREINKYDDDDNSTNSADKSRSCRRILLKFIEM